MNRRTNRGIKPEFGTLHCAHATNVIYHVAQKLPQMDQLLLTAQPHLGRHKNAMQSNSMGSRYFGSQPCYMQTSVPLETLCRSIDISSEQDVELPIFKVDGYLGKAANYAPSHLKPIKFISNYSALEKKKTSDEL